MFPRQWIFKTRSFGLTPCRDVGSQLFGGQCCLCLHCTMLPLRKYFFRCHGNKLLRIVCGSLSAPPLYQLASAASATSDSSANSSNPVLNFSTISCILATGCSWSALWWKPLEAFPLHARSGVPLFSLPYSRCYVLHFYCSRKHFLCFNIWNSRNCKLLLLEHMVQILSAPFSQEIQNSWSAARISFPVLKSQWLMCRCVGRMFLQSVFLLTFVLTITVGKISF